MPEHSYVRFADLRKAAGNHSNDVRKVPKIDDYTSDTYFLPVLALCTFKSTRFKYPKTSSTGDPNQP